MEHFLSLRIELLSLRGENGGNMGTTWIVTANAGRAKIFAESSPSENLEEIHDMVDTSSRMRTTELERDRIGPTAATKSKHNTGAPTPNKAYEPETTPERHHEELFARNLASYLLQGYTDGRFKKLMLTATPEFLGVMRKLLDPQLKPLTVEINKDYTQLSPTQLREQLREQMRPHLPEA
jgi:protein required for attachment to host cells